MASLIRIVRGSIITSAKCACGAEVANHNEKAVTDWANAHDTAGGSPDYHVVSITQWAIPVDVEIR